MQIEKKTIRKLFLTAVGCIILYWILHETERVARMMDVVGGIFRPFVIGSALAFIVNVPMRALERGLRFVKKPGLRRSLAMLLTVVVVILVLAGVVVLLIPQITETFMSLIPKLTSFFMAVEERVRGFLENNPRLMELIYSNTEFENLDWAGLIQKVMGVVTSGISTIAVGTFSAVGSITGGIVDTVIGLVFMVYCLSRKEILARQGRRIIYSFLPERFCDEVIRILRLTNRTFCNFLSGQCLEACILACLFAVTMAILRMPYITLISVLIGVTALIPVVGAFVGCALGAFFILVNDPFQAVVFVIMFLILQQIENNMIYPKVVGTSIGLPGMWVLFAVGVGGEIMGVAGMFIMIPVMAVIYTLAREVTSKRVAERGIDPEKLKDQPPEIKSHFKEKREKKKKAALLQKLQERKEHPGSDENNSENNGV